MSKLVQQWVSKLPSPRRENVQLQLFALTKVPLIFFCRPSIVASTDSRVEIRMPLFRNTKNHWNSMYFGALAAGMDVAGGWMAFEKSQTRPVSLLFKDFHAEFYRRADGDVHFICEDGKRIDEAIRQTNETGERVNFPVTVTAIVPSKSQEPVAKGTLTLSLKKVEKKSGAMFNVA